MIAELIVLVLAPGPLVARQAEAPLMVTQSTKPIAGLEYCVATAMDGLTLSGPFRDGEDRVVIYGNRMSEVKVYLAVTLIRQPNGTKIEVRGRNPDALNSFRETLAVCS